MNRQTASPAWRRPRRRPAVLAAAALAVPPGTRFDEDKLKASEGAVKKALTDLEATPTRRPTSAEGHRRHVADRRVQGRPWPVQAIFERSRSPASIPDASVRESKNPEAPLRRAINIREGTLQFDGGASTRPRRRFSTWRPQRRVTIAPTLPQPPPPHLVVPLTVQAAPPPPRGHARWWCTSKFDEIKTERISTRPRAGCTALAVAPRFQRRVQARCRALSHTHRQLEGATEAASKSSQLSRNSRPSRRTSGFIRTPVQRLFRSSWRSRDSATFPDTGHRVLRNQGSGRPRPDVLQEDLRGDRLHGSGREPVRCRSVSMPRSRR